MTFQLRQTLGLDTSQYDTALKRVRTETDAAFGAMGQKIGQGTQGWRRFSGAISGTVGSVTSLVGVFGLATAAVGGVVAGVSALAAASAKAREEAVAELAAREKTLAAVRDTVRELARLGGATQVPGRDTQRSIRGTAAEARGQLAGEFGASREREEAARKRLAQIEGDAFGAVGALFRLTSGDTPESLRRTIEEERRLRDRLDSEAGRVTSGERSALQEESFRRRGAARTLRIGAEAEAMRLSGSPEDAEMSLERDRFERQMFELEERKRAGDEFAQAEMASARMVHEARMANFAREKQTRLTNEKEVALREKREAEMARTTRMRTIADTRMETAMDRARALGDERGVERLTVQRDRVRRMRSIMDANLPEAERNRALRELRRSAGIADLMSMFGLGGEDGSGAGGLTHGISATASGFVRRQVFGSGSASPSTAGSAQQQTASGVTQMATMMRQIVGMLSRVQSGLGVIG